MAHDEKMFDLAESQPEAALIWPWMITWFDDWGRALASPKRIKSQLFPNIATVTLEMIDNAINAYAAVGLIELYEDSEHQYMAIPSVKWFKWQTHIRSEKRVKDNSKFPPCPSDRAQMHEGDNEVRASARGCAQVTENLYPSPSPSPSLSLSLSLSSTERENAREDDEDVSEIDESQMTDTELAVSRLARFHLAQKLTPQMNDHVKDRIVAMCNEYPSPWILEAIEEARLRGARSLGYLDTVLANWTRDGKSPSERRKEMSISVTAHRERTPKDAEWEDIERRFFHEQ